MLLEYVPLYRMNYWPPSIMMTSVLPALKTSAMSLDSDSTAGLTCIFMHIFIELEHFYVMSSQSSTQLVPASMTPVAIWHFSSIRVLVVEDVHTKSVICICNSDC